MLNMLMALTKVLFCTHPEIKTSDIWIQKQIRLDLF